MKATWQGLLNKNGDIKKSGQLFYVVVTLP